MCAPMWWRLGPSRRPFWGGTGREDIVSDRGWFDQLSDKYVSSIPLGRVASPPTSSGPSCFFPDRVPATSRAGPASERRQVDPLKVEDRYAAARASVFDGTTAGYLSGLFAAFERANARILSDLDWQLNVPYGRDARETFDLCRASARALGTVLFSWRILAVARQVAVSLHGRSMGQSRLQCRPGRVSPVSGHLRARSHREHPGGAIGRRPRLADLATEPAHHSCGPLGGRASGRGAGAGMEDTQPGDGNARRGRGHQRHIRSDAAGADDAERSPAP